MIARVRHVFPALALIFPGLVSFAFAAPPEIIPVRVPSGEVVKWFPPGTEWTGLTFPQFEALTRAAREGSARRESDASPRLLRAGHEARWEEGVLYGRSTLRILPGKSGPGPLRLEPWTPAIDPGAKGSVAVRFDDEGRAEIPVAASPDDPGERTAVINWQQRSRPGSSGRRFVLGLPGSEASEFVLDLPEGIRPDGPAGPSQGPLPGERAGRSTWRFIGKLGAVTLSLSAREGTDDATGSSRFWVSGTTRVELGESAADWVLSWAVADGPRGRSPLRLILDPGLELLSVSGLEVEGFQAETSPEGTIVSVRLRARPEAGVFNLIPTGLTVRARAIVPKEGPWIVPSARPLNAEWTGGLTTVRLDPARALQGVRRLSGREVARRVTDPIEGRILAFEASRPAPVAELTFRKPGVEVSAEVQGRLYVSNTAPRLTGRVIWRFDRGEPLELAFDLPPSWFPDRVGIEGLDGPVPWHSDAISGGGVRVHVVPPSADRPDRTLVLNVSATSSVAGGRGPLALPRVRPVDARVSDEVWTAQGEEGVVLTPTQAKGLAWIDPQVVFPASISGRDLPTLAWRWTADDASARVDRERPGTAPGAAVQLIVTVAPERLELSARIGINVGDDPIKTLAIGLSPPSSDPNGWRLLDESTGRELPLTPLPDRDRVRAGLECSGPAWNVVVPQSVRGRVDLILSYSGPASESGAVPLIVLPNALKAIETVLVLVGKAVQTKAIASGVVTMDPQLVSDSFAAEGPSGGEGRPWPLSGAYRRAHAFRVENPIGQISIHAVALEPADQGGVIRNAVLRTVVNPNGANRQRLVLKVAAQSVKTIEVELPTGARLDRVSRDGQEVQPLRDGARLSIPLRTTSIAPVRSLVTISIDYLSPDLKNADPSRVRPDRPRLSLPCLGLSWEVVTTDPWRVATWSKFLTSLDPGPFQTSIFERSASFSRLFSRRGWRIPAVTKVSSEFDTKMLNGLPNELSLADWLTRWDAGEFPIVVDQPALAEAGWGPRSRVAPPRIASGTPNAAVAALEAVGLTMIPIGNARLITTRKNAEPSDATPLNDPAYEPAMRQAIAWGADLTDRFQSISQWRDEPTPRSSAESLGDASTLKGRKSRRFVVSGWPEQGLEVQLVDGLSQARRGWVVAFAVMAAGLAAKRFSAPMRTAATVALVGLGWLATPYVPPQLSGAAEGLIQGALGYAFLSLGCLIPSTLPFRFPGRRRRLRGSSSRIRRLPPSRVITPILIAFAATSYVLGQSPFADGVPILALFPYDGNLDLSRPPDRVLLRLSDHRRLSALAEQGRAKPPARLLATSAVHRVVWPKSGGRVVLLETDLGLAGDGEGHARWSFPVENVREITATIDGQPAPIRVEPGGRTATVQVTLPPRAEREESRFLLRISRTVVVRKVDVEESMSLAVNPVATALVEVGPHPDGLVAECESARGPTLSNAQGMKGFPGPIDRLDITWRRSSKGSKPGATGMVDGLTLWDATLAGDRVRTRLTYHDPRGTTLIRIKLGAGVLVRSWTIPGEVDTTLEGSADNPEWVARIRPPLPDGAVVSIDSWRPSAVDAEARSALALPILEPAGVERFGALLAFRRPPEWTGRLTPKEPAEAVGEEAFVRAWGALPIEPLTLSGAMKRGTTFADTSAPTVETGPEPARFRVSQSVRAVISPGRLDLNIVADLNESGGNAREARIFLPRQLRLVRVETEGLTDFSESDHTLTLRFDGPPLRHRQVRLVAWCPLLFDSMASALIAREVEVPWPRWPGQLESKGSLNIVAPIRFQLINPNDNSTVFPDPPMTTLAAPFRANYRVLDPENPGSLRWEIEPPRVAVRLQSRLKIDPDRVEWLAVLRYDVSGGPLDTINLRLPADWAKSAIVRLVGVGHQQVKEAREPFTFWTIRPERPVWGSLHVIVRSSRPLAPGDSVAFPELSPLGRGAVDTTLRVVNQSGRSLAFENIQGLQPVAPAALPMDEEIAASSLKAATVTNYRVIKPGWSLRIDEAGEPREDSREQRDIQRAELYATIDLKGNAFGLARYEIGARSGAFLPLKFEGEATALYAAVNGSPASILKAGPGRWLVPLAEETTSRVSLTWSSNVPEGDAIDSGRSIPLPLPVIESARVPVVLSVRAPLGVEVASPPGQLRASNPDRVDLERARRLSRQIIDSLVSFDRSARKQGEDLVAAVVRLGLRLRQAERASAADPSLLFANRQDTPVLIRLASQELFGRVSETLSKASLTEFEASARDQLGVGRPVPIGPYVPTLEPALAVQIRPLGYPHLFLGELNDGVGPTIVLKKSRETNNRHLYVVIGYGMLIGLVSILASMIARRPSIARRSGQAALVIGLILTLPPGGVWWLSGALGLVIAGRFIDVT